MTPPADSAPRRRATDLHPEHAAHLEGRIDTMQAQIDHIDEKVDVALTKIDKLTDIVTEMRIESAQRSAQIEVVRQDHGIDANDDIGKLRKKMTDALVISLCIVLILALLVFAEHNLLSPAAARIGQAAIGHAAP